MNKIGGLGKGIDALFGDVRLQEAAGEIVVQELPIDSIDPNREQPRKRFDQEELEQLAQSIRSVGVIQPISVHLYQGRYSIIAGERRWRASRIAGLKTVPAIVRDYDKVQQMEVALIENLQRQDLNPLEQAQGIRKLMDECGLTQEAAAKRLGKSRPAIANLLRLLNLPESIQAMVRVGELSEGQARAIAGLSDPKAQEKLAMAAHERHMTVRQVEEAVRRMVNPEPERERTDKAARESVHILEETARHVFGTKVQVEGDDTKGRITIHYYSAEDLERIYAVITTGERGASI